MENEKKHIMQEQFHRDGARNRWLFGGNRTGKTHCGAQEAVWWACRTHPVRNINKPTDGWVVSLSTQVQRDVAQRKVLELLAKEKGIHEHLEFEFVMLTGKQAFPQKGVIDFITVKNGEQESRIGFKSCEQGREKFQGASLDWVWFDEEPDEDIYEECLMRTLDKAGNVWGTMTPLKGKTWVYDRIYLEQTPDISVRTMTWEDNPFLEAKEIARMEKNYSLESLESRRFGRFCEGTGLVFKEFGDENIISDVTVWAWRKKAVYNGITIDPGYTNPTAVLWCMVDGDENIVVLADFKRSGLGVAQIAKEILDKSKEMDFAVDNVFIDSAAAAATLAEPRSVAEQFRACGINVNTSVDKNVREGLHKMKSLFQSVGGQRKLFVGEGCSHLIRELRSYFWGDNERPVARNDHCIDALRYFVMTACVPKPKMSCMEKFKRRLTSENR